MLARCIPRYQGCPYEAGNAADGCYDTSATADHVGQHLLSDGHSANIVEVHNSLIHIDICVNAKSTLAPATIVYQHVDLKMHIQMQKSTRFVRDNNPTWRDSSTKNKKYCLLFIYCLFQSVMNAQECSSRLWIQGNVQFLVHNFTSQDFNQEPDVFILCCLFVFSLLSN